MAKYTVTHACGHEQTHQLFGPGKERDRKIEWLEGHDCSDCYHAKKDAARAAANVSAAEANAAAGLPALEGSEKQVAWAESIRRPICEALAAAEAAFTPDPDLSETAGEELGDAVALLVDEIRTRAAAKWWIDEGRDLGIADKGDALYYLETRVRTRKLAPTAAAEAKAISERRAELKRARDERELALLDELAACFDPAGLRWDEASQAVAGVIAGHRVEILTGGMGEIRVDGQEIHRSGPVLSLVRDWAWAQRRAAESARRAARSDALAGATVAAVAKAKQELTVTLADGRVLLGASDRSGWSLTRERVGYSGEAIDSEHPEAVRLAAEAKAWLKANGGAK